MGVGEVVRLHRVHRASQIDRFDKALAHTADEMHQVHAAGCDAVNDVQSRLSGELGCLRGVFQCALEGVLGLLRGLVALTAGVLEDFLRRLAILVGGVVEVTGLVGFGARVGTLVHCCVVRVCLGVVRVDRVAVRLERLHGLLLGRMPCVDGRLGLLLRPGDRIRVGVEGLPRRLTGVRGAHPLLGVYVELLVEAVGGLSLPGSGVELADSLADAFEGSVEVLQMGGGFIDLRDVPVDQLLGVVALAQLPFVDLRAQRIGDVVTGRADGLGRAVRTDVVECVGGHVRGGVDGLAGRLLDAVDSVASLFGCGIDEVAEAHQFLTPQWCSTAVVVRW